MFYVDRSMKSFSTLSGGVLIGILTIGVILSAGCITSKTTPTSSQPVFDTSATTAPITQPPAPAQNTPNVPCRSGLTNCNGFCRDVSTDISNCGSCGIVCPGNSVCIAGTCQCKDGYSSCNGVCKDISSDAKNCGACGAVCPSGLICIKGTCGVTCTGGKTGCGAVCADLKSDTKNCGACGVTCPSGQVCNDGQCGISCINNLKYCNGQCRDLTADSVNCGSCGIICPSGTTCQNGQCIQTCISGLTFCNGYCRDLRNDVNNCGSCGVQCATGLTCSNGNCIAVYQALGLTWSGSWQSNFGTIIMTQTGSSVHGDYSYGATRGELDGTINPSIVNILSGTWRESTGGTGRFEFTMSGSMNQFSGWYTTGSSTTHNTWNGNR